MPYHVIHEFCSDQWPWPTCDLWRLGTGIKRAKSWKGKRHLSRCYHDTRNRVKISTSYVFSFDLLSPDLNLTLIKCFQTPSYRPESYVIWRETIENIISVPDSPATSGVPPNESQASDQRRKQSLVMTEGSSGRGVPVTSSGRRKKMPKLEPGV